MLITNLSFVDILRKTCKKQRQKRGMEGKVERKEFEKFKKTEKTEGQRTEVTETYTSRTSSRLHCSNTLQDFKIQKATSLLLITDRFITLKLLMKLISALVRSRHERNVPCQGVTAAAVEMEEFSVVPSRSGWQWGRRRRKRAQRMA